jgi:hypothetical protein
VSPRQTSSAGVIFIVKAFNKPSSGSINNQLFNKNTHHNNSTLTMQDEEIVDAPGLDVGKPRTMEAETDLST